MLLKIYPDNPSERQIKMVVDCLQNDGVIIYPTDTVYSLACSIFKPKAIERIGRIKGVDPQKANFSIICHDLSNISEYTKPIPNTVFKLMKRVLPGPFTFILEANSNVPKIFQSRKKTIGIRIPGNQIPLEIVRLLGNPLMTTSVHDEDTLVEYSTDPELINEKYAKTVDIVIDGGYGDIEASTVVDCTGDEPLILRQGKGNIEEYL